MLLRSAASFLLAILTIAGAVELERVHQKVAASVATHGTALAHALKSKRARKARKKINATLRGAALVGGSGQDDDNDDDNDDDDDDDDAEAQDNVTAVPKTLNVSKQTLELSTALFKGVKASSTKVSVEAEKKAAAEKAAAEQKAAAEKAAAEKAHQEAEAEKKRMAEEKARRDALAAAKRKQAGVKKELKLFTDTEAFDAQMAVETKLMTNETQSPALASFLGEFRTEMRKYAMPAYPAYLQGKLDTADKKVEALETELESKEAKLETKKDAEKAPVQAKAKKVVEPEQAEGPTAKEVEQKAGETWAISFFANVTLLAVVFAMASTENRTVRNYTWFLMDQVVAILLAVMYVNAFSSVLDFHGICATSVVIASILHAVTMLAVVLTAAVFLRKHQVTLAILCGAGAHVVSFSSIHAAAATQNFWVGMSYGYLMCIFGLCTLGLALAIIGYLVYTAKDRAALTKEDGFMDKTDDVETDFGGMAFSVAFTMFVRFMITGHHPVDDESGFNHTQEQRTAMFFYSIFCLVVAGIVVRYCSAKAASESTSYGMKRVLTFCTVVAVLNVAWAWLYWGEWEFFEALYPDDAIKGRMMFAVTTTVIGGCGLVGLSKIKTDGKSESVKAEKKVALTALALVVAWSWELCFDAALETMCDGVSHPVVWKVGSTCAMAAIVLPVYAMYLKPFAMKCEEELGA